MKTMKEKFNIVSYYLLELDGSKMSVGGLERWCRDYALLANKKGYEVTVYQKAIKNFEVYLPGGIRVIGVLCSPYFKGNFTLSSWIEKNINWKDPIVFVSQELALSGKFHRALSVNHGIWWHGDLPFWKKLYIRRFHFKHIQRMKGIICVDSNYINWCHTEFPHRKEWQDKLSYIPNYADLKLFPIQKSNTDITRNRCFTILYPRRIVNRSVIDHPRGLNLFLDSLEGLRKRGFMPKVIFAGLGELRSDIQKWAEEHGWSDSFEIMHLEFDNMASVYAQCDVVVLSSRGEGCPLSAIEGIVSGKPTVVTHIGGLPNIVIDGLNGYICDLSPKSLADTIIRAINENCLNNTVILNAVRQCLSKERWEERVWGYTKRCLNLTN